MAACHIGTAALRDAATPGEIAQHLRHISASLPIERVTDELLTAIETGLLPPQVFDIYISAIKSPAAVVRALRQPFSKSLRYAAIKHFGRALKKPNSETIWDEIGGTQGLLRLWSDLSVSEVDLFCRAIGWAATKSIDGDSSKQLRITELLQGLLPEKFSESLHQSKDERPIHHRYAHLLPACTSEFLKQLLLDDGDPFPSDRWPVRRVAQTHWPMLQDLVLRTLRHQNVTAKEGPQPVDWITREFLDLFLPHLLHGIPQIAGHTQGFSASMSFSLEALRIIARGEGDYFDGTKFWSLLAVPLIRRVLSRDADLKTTQEIFDAVLSYLQACPSRLTTLASWQETLLFNSVARCWSTRSRVFEKQLINTAKFQQFGISDGFPKVDELFKVVNLDYRYDLLRLIILHRPGSKADIDQESDLQGLQIKQWPISLFLSIPPRKAHALLLRLIKSKPSRDFLEIQGRTSSISILAQPPSLGLRHGDPQLLNTLLNSQTKATQQDAHKDIKRHQELASKSRDQGTRAFHAKSAAFYAIASGSLDLYDQIMMWSRRFVRDPLTLRSIYSIEAINTQESIALLSGIPEDLRHLTTGSIHNLVEKGNETLMNILGTALLALKEPSFNSQDWNGPRALFRDVIIARITRSRRLKRSFGLTEDAIYEMLWAPTLETLLQAERIGLQPENEALSFKSPSGPSSATRGYQDFPSQKASTAASYRFLDSFARARNNIWAHYRPTVLSDCASLPEGWPRGLPVQALIGDFICRIETHAAKAHTPYLSSRSAAVVFLDRNPVVEGLSEEKRDAIGGFVDRYETALRIQVMQKKPGKEQEDEASAILAHIVKLCCAIDPLSQNPGHLSRHEAIQLCKRVFTHTLPDLNIPAIQDVDDFYSKGYPVLSVGLSNLDPQERLEWNPMEGKSSKKTTRRVAATLLDCMIEATSHVSFSPLMIPEVSASTRGFASVWTEEKIRNLTMEGRAVEEGTLVSTLLFLESRTIKSPKIFSSAFPSARDVRYPLVFLDLEFIEQSKGEDFAAQQTIFSLRYKAPPKILHALSDKALEALFDQDLRPSESSLHDRNAYFFLRLLSKSDRPELATKGILTTLIDHPEASSWHRQLLSQSFIRSLSKMQAESFMNLLVNSIQAKLDEQIRLRESTKVATQGRSDTITSTPPESIIKITTIKHLAQLLDDADALSLQDSVQILSGLLLKSSHVDVRVAVIESMISKLERCYSGSFEGLGNQIFRAFEKLTQIMGSLDGDGVLDEQDWKSADLSGNLPKVMDDLPLNETAPIFQKFCSALHFACLSREQKDKLLHRVIVPTLANSQICNSRWMAIFARKFGIESSYRSLPAATVHPHMLQALINSDVSRGPLWAFNSYHQLGLIGVQAPRWLKVFNSKLRNDPELRHLNAVRHWLHLYDGGSDLLMNFSDRLATSLRTPNQFSSSGDSDTHPQITLSHIQKCLVEQASALLWLQDPNFKLWNLFINRLSPLYVKSDGVCEELACKSVLEQIIAKVEDIRGSNDWQHSPYETDTPFLPSTFSLRLLLLPYPQLQGHLPENKKAAVFSNQLLELLKEVQGLGLAHREKLDAIYHAASNTSSSSKILLAFTIAKPPQQIDKEKANETELRIELADRLLGTIKPQGEEKEKITTLVKGWIRSDIEEVRMRGARATRRLGLDIDEQDVN